MRALRPNTQPRPEMHSRNTLEPAYRLRAEFEPKALRSQLSVATGIIDEDTLDQLLSHGIKAEILKALELSPLFFVAWADGELDEDEELTIMAHVESRGITADEPSHHFISYWLEVPPSPEYFQLWSLYISSMCRQADHDSYLRLKFATLHQVKMVARASGDFWGFGNAMSIAEREEMKKLEEAFAA